jgi:hypothetical protein
MQVRVRPVLIATHLEQSIDLANHKQGAINKNDLTVFIRLMQGLVQVSESPDIFQGSSSLPVDEPHVRFLVQGHILSSGGDALTDVLDLLDSVVDC